MSVAERDAQAEANPHAPNRYRQNLTAHDERDSVSRMAGGWTAGLTALPERQAALQCRSQMNEVNRSPRAF